MVDRYQGWLLFGLVLLVGFSPTVAGMLWRATISVWLVWANLIEFEAFSNFASNFHW